jgi:hypothetical protein
MARRVTDYVIRTTLAFRVRTRRVIVVDGSA